MAGVSNHERNKSRPSFEMRARCALMQDEVQKIKGLFKKAKITPSPSGVADSSSTLGSSMVEGIVQVSTSAIFLMVPRRIFPERSSAAEPP